MELALYYKLVIFMEQEYTGYRSPCQLLLYYKIKTVQ